MHLTNNATTILVAVIAALSSGGVSLFIFWRQTLSPHQQRRMQDAWQQRAEALDERLRQRYEQELRDLRADLEAERNRNRPRPGRGGHDD